MSGERAENSGYLYQGLISRFCEEIATAPGFLAVLPDVVGAAGVSKRLDYLDLFSNMVVGGPAHLRKQSRGSSPSIVDW